MYKQVTASDFTVDSKIWDDKLVMNNAKATVTETNAPYTFGENFTQGEDFTVSALAQTKDTGSNKPVDYTVTLLESAKNYTFGAENITRDPDIVVTVNNGTINSSVINGLGGSIGGGVPLPPAPAKYTVTFMTNGHGTAPAVQTVTRGEFATSPAMSAEGYVFGGWYTTAACTTAFDFTKGITANVTLYAKWTEEEFDLTEALGAIKLKARTAYTAKNNTKVNINVAVTEGQEQIDAIKDAGYTVTYKFYRSTKKASKYAAVFEKNENTYTNTKGVKGKMYYYKARLVVKNEEGVEVGKTELKQCLYGNRVFKGQAEEE